MEVHGPIAKEALWDSSGRVAWTLVEPSNSSDGSEKPSISHAAYSTIAEGTCYCGFCTRHHALRQRVPSQYWIWRLRLSKYS